jgi:hypothetical protein
LKALGQSFLFLVMISGFVGIAASASNLIPRATGVPWSKSVPPAQCVIFQSQDSDSVSCWKLMII